MNTNYIIRHETENEFRTVEVLTRESFWNVYRPGCSEHYFVHTMRSHPDYLPELSHIMELDGRIIANIHYLKAALRDEDGNEKEILSFGPIGVHPDFQRQGYGKALIDFTFREARRMGYDAVVIFGNPGNYTARGFVSCKKKNVCLDGGNCPTAMLVKELVPGALDGRKWIYCESTAGQCCDDEAAVAAFDATFPPKEAHWMPSQEEFYIYSHSAVVW